MLEATHCEKAMIYAETRESDLQNYRDGTRNTSGSARLGAEFKDEEHI
jgi:hypothetical protein